MSSPGKLPGFFSLVVPGALFPQGLQWLHPLGFALGPPQGWLLGQMCQFGSVEPPWELSRSAGGG